MTVERELGKLRMKEFELKLRALTEEYFVDWGYNTEGSVPSEGLFVLGNFAGIVKGSPRTEELMKKWDEALGIPA